MTEEEFEIWRDYTTDDDCKELRQLEIELEKIMKKEEKEKVINFFPQRSIFNSNFKLKFALKERERIKNEKKKQTEYLKELKKPKEDLECDNSIVS